MMPTNVLGSAMVSMCRTASITRNRWNRPSNIWWLSLRFPNLKLKPEGNITKRHPLSLKNPASFERASESFGLARGAARKGREPPLFGTLRINPEVDGTIPLGIHLDPAPVTQHRQMALQNRSARGYGLGPFAGRMFHFWLAPSQQILWVDVPLVFKFPKMIWLEPLRRKHGGVAPAKVKGCFSQTTPSYQRGVYQSWLPMKVVSTTNHIQCLLQAFLQFSSFSKGKVAASMETTSKSNFCPRLFLSSTLSNASG